LSPLRSNARLLAFGCYGAAFAFAAFSLVLNISPEAAKHKLPSKRVAAVYTEDIHDSGQYASVNLRSFVNTYIQIDPIQSAIFPGSSVLGLHILQEQIVFDQNKKEISSQHMLDKVINEIGLSVESSDFEFAAGAGERHYSPGAALPIDAAWTASPKRAGLLHMLVRFKNIDNLKLKVGEEEEKTTGTGDIPISAYVSETSGLSPFVQQYFLWGAAVGAALAGLILQYILGRQGKEKPA
jgi:hypothetical protein